MILFFDDEKHQYIDIIIITIIIVIIIKLIIIMPFFLEHRRVRIWDIYAEFHFSERARSLSKKKNCGWWRSPIFSPSCVFITFLQLFPSGSALRPLNCARVATCDDFWACLTWNFVTIKNRVFKPVTKCIQVSSCLSLSLSLSLSLCASWDMSNRLMIYEMSENYLESIGNTGNT